MAKATATTGLEVHSHSFVSGKRAGGHYEGDGKWHTGTFSHSHEGGNQPHQHEHTGPASYTIDKDDWYRSTGLRGGGRKVFTARPTGEQMPIVELEEWQKSFEVVVCEPMPSKGQPGCQGEGPGIALPLRVARQFKMPFTVRDGRKVSA